MKMGNFEFNTLQEVIVTKFNMPQEAVEDYLSFIEYHEFPKNYVMLKQERVCDKVWIMLSGALRFYYIADDGTEYNTWFSFEHEIICDFNSMIFSKPSSTNIKLLEDSILVSITYKQIQYLLSKYHSFALWYIKLIEKEYISLVEERLNSLQFLNAKQRYEELLQTNPQVLQRVSLGHIASFLRITKETLSRIRAGKL